MYEKKGPRYDRPDISLIEQCVTPFGVSLFIGGREGVSNIALLKEHGITTVLNCAVNLDINYVQKPLNQAGSTSNDYGHGPIKYYKLGLVDGPGNNENMMLAGYFLLQGALTQILPAKETYPYEQGGNVLVNCRSGRSRSVAVVSLFLHHNMPKAYPTLDDAIHHVRISRELHKDEWFEAPKPVLIESARKASKWIRQIDQSG